jgi:hypothetical protein
MLLKDCSINLQKLINEVTPMRDRIGQNYNFGFVAKYFDS